MTDGNVSRRRFVKALGASGVAGGLAGCTARAEAGPNTVQIAGNTDLKTYSDELEKQLKQAGMSKDISLEVIAGMSSTGARQQQYNRWLSANLGQPSLFMMDSGWTIPFIGRDQLADLTEELPEVTKMIKSTYFDTFRETAQGDDGTLYAVPLFPTTGNMLYRKDLVKEAGFSPDSNNWATEPLSWRRFAEVTKQTKQQTDTKYGFSFQAKSYGGLSCCDFREFTGSWGGSYFGAKKYLFGPVGDRPITVDSKPVVDSTRMVKTFIDGDGDGTLDSMPGDIAPREVLQWQEESSRRPFAAGNVVMHRNWPYAIALQGAEDSFGKDLGVMPIPYGVEESEAKFDGYGGSVSSLGGWHIALNPNAENKEAAKEVLRALTDKEVQLFLFETIGWLPPRPSLFDSQRARDVPVMGRYLDTLRLSLENSIPRPVTVAWPPESAKIAQQANAGISDLKPPKQAMSELQRQLENIEQATLQGTGSENRGSLSAGGG